MMQNAVDRVVTSQGDCSILQGDLFSIFNWSETWGMNFNLKKCKHLRITKKKDPITFNYQLSPNIISLPSPNIISLPKEEKDLRIFLSHNLAWRCHILIKVNTANRLLRKAFLNSYIHLVRPHLEYACEVWSPSQSYIIDWRYWRRTTEGNQNCC